MANTATLQIEIEVDDNGSAKIRQLGNTAETAASKSEKGFNKAKKSLGSFNSLIKTATSLLAALGITLSAVALVQAADNIVKIGSAYQQSMAEVEAVSGAAGASLQNLDDIARELGETTEWSASQAADGLKYLSMAGFDAEESVAALPGVLDLATAGNIDLGSAADIASNALTAMRLEVDELGRVNDTFIATISSSNTNMEMMAESFKYAAPVAAGYGYEIETLSGLIGILGNSGIQGSMAGTQLAAAFSDAEAVFKKYGVSATNADGSTKDLVDAIELLEDRGASAADIMEIFGDRAGRAVLALKGTGADAIREYISELENAEGATSSLAEIMRDTFEGDLKSFNSALESLKIDIFNEYEGEMRESLQNATTWLREHKEEIISFVGAVGSGIDSVVSSFGSMFERLNNFGTIMGAVSVGDLGVFDALSMDAKEAAEWIDENSSSSARLKNEISDLESQVEELEGLGAYDAVYQYFYNIFNGYPQDTENQIETLKQKIKILKTTLESSNTDVGSSFKATAAQAQDSWGMSYDELVKQQDKYNAKIKVSNTGIRSSFELTADQAQDYWGMSYIEILANQKVYNAKLEAEAKASAEAQKETVQTYTDKYKELTLSSTDYSIYQLEREADAFVETWDGNADTLQAFMDYHDAKMDDILDKSDETADKIGIKWGDLWGDAKDDLKDWVKTGKADFSDVYDSFVDMLLDMWIAWLERIGTMALKDLFTDEAVDWSLSSVLGLSSSSSGTSGLSSISSISSLSSIGSKLSSGWDTVSGWLGIGETASSGTALASVSTMFETSSATWESSVLSAMDTGAETWASSILSSSEEASSLFSSEITSALSEETAGYIDSLLSTTSTTTATTTTVAEGSTVGSSAAGLSSGTMAGVGAAWVMFGDEITDFITEDLTSASKEGIESVFEGLGIVDEERDKDVYYGSDGTMVRTISSEYYGSADEYSSGSIDYLTEQLGTLTDRLLASQENTLGEDSTDWTAYSQGLVDEITATWEVMDEVFGSGTASMVENLTTTSDSFGSFVESLSGVSVSAEDASTMVELATRAFEGDSTATSELISLLESFGLSADDASVAASALISSVNSTSDSLLDISSAGDDASSSLSVVSSQLTTVADEAVSTLSEISGYADSASEIVASIKNDSSSYQSSGSSVSSHALGGIYTRPTILHHVAEAGYSEAILPLPYGPGMMKDIADHVSEIRSSGSQPITVNLTVRVANHIDGEELKETTRSVVTDAIADINERGGEMAEVRVM